MKRYKDSNGSAIGPARVWLKYHDLPGLAMSRSFGDSIASSVGVIAEPDITVTKLTREAQIIVIASDGIWEFFSNEVVLEIIRPYFEIGDSKGASEELCAKAIARWKSEEEVVDDITCIILFLRVE